MKFNTQIYYCLNAIVVGSICFRGVQGEENQQRLRGEANSPYPVRRHRHLSVLSDGSIDFIDNAKGRSAIVRKGSSDEKPNNGGYVMTFKLGPGKVIQARSSPQDQEIEIRRLGNKENDLTEDDRAFLSELGDALDGDDGLDTYDVDTLPSQTSRMAKILNDWPETLDIDYKLDVEAEAERTAKRDEKLASLPPLPDDAPTVPGTDDRRRTNVATVPMDQQLDGHSHRSRRLVYKSLCSSMNSFVLASHDDLWRSYGADSSTYYGYVSMHPHQPCAEGTRYWQNNAWQCFSTEPNHSKSIEFAYGNCFGRCGPDCGSGTQFTQDCLDHDSCVRFGHSLTSLWCDDEFFYTIDDALFAPNCL